MRESFFFFFIKDRKETFLKKVNSASTTRKKKRVPPSAELNYRIRYCTVYSARCVTVSRGSRIFSYSRTYNVHICLEDHCIYVFNVHIMCEVWRVQRVQAGLHPGAGGPHPDPERGHDSQAVADRHPAAAGPRQPAPGSCCQPSRQVSLPG